MSSRPNILLVTTDQQRGDCLGVDPHHHPVMTPHLSQIAHEGVTFTRAYTDCPLCVPARYTIMTGKCAYTHGVINNAKAMPSDPAETLAGRLTRAGYQTHAAGKMHFHPARARYGFERMRLLPEDYVNWLERTPYPGGYRFHGLGGNEVYPAFAGVPIEYTATHWTVDESIEFLRQRDPNAPFFLWTSFEAPHSPYDPPERFVNLYDGIKIPEPACGDWVFSAGAPYFIAERRARLKIDELTPEIILKDRLHYYAQITHIDYELGRLFGELGTQKLWDNTIILFASDHGDMLGDHGIFHKTCFYEGAARVPFVLRLPKSMSSPWGPCRMIDRPVRLADIYPTLLALAGCWQEEEAEERDGRNLLTLDESGADDEWIYGYCSNSFGNGMATNGKWKYIYYAWGAKEQLFNLVEDPAELHDRAGDESCAAVLAECRERLWQNVPIIRDTEANSPGRLLAIDKPPADDVTCRSQNPFAWRGPIRYGGHW